MTSYIPMSLGAVGFPVAASIPGEASGGDLNNVLNSGIYQWGLKPANAPGSYNNGILLVFGRGTTAVQFACDLWNNQPIMHRYKDGTTWTAWKNIKVT